jgi:hypothetical protein
MTAKMRSISTSAFLSLICGMRASWTARYDQAAGARVQSNIFFANERDVCNFGKGGGQLNPAP